MVHCRAYIIHGRVCDLFPTAVSGVAPAGCGESNLRHGYGTITTTDFNQTTRYHDYTCMMKAAPTSAKAVPKAAPKAVPKAAPKAAPTEAPKAAPTEARNPALRVAATGDPHLKNIYGERFDLMKKGHHTLLNIPRRAKRKSAMIRVDAKSERMGSSCGDLYFTEVNITGAWVREGALRFAARSSHKIGPAWHKVGKLGVKVVRGKTKEGVAYLNFFVRNLALAKADVGGLLGADDHTDAATPQIGCRRIVSLLQTAPGDTRQISEG